MDSLNTYICFYEFFDGEINRTKKCVVRAENEDGAREIIHKIHSSSCHKDHPINIFQVRRMVENYLPVPLP